MADNRSQRDQENKKPQNALSSLFGGINGDNFFQQIFAAIAALFMGGFDKVGQAASAVRSNVTHYAQQGGAAIGRGIDNGRELIGQGVDALKNLIGKHESGNDYNRVYGAGVKRMPLEDMTVNEVLAWQKNYVRQGSPSSAAGKYQIVQDTLRGLKTEMKLTGEEKFDAKMQDKMFEHLAVRRGLNDYLSGKISQDKMMTNLSQEWASLPKNDGGRSYYHGDGLNRASVAPSSVRQALEIAAGATNTNTPALAAASANVRYTAAAQTGQTLENTPRISGQMNRAVNAEAPVTPVVAATVTAPAPQRQVALQSPSFAFS